MFVVGLTGGIATGKSTVSSMLRELGCPIIDADLVAREVVQPGQPAWHAVVKAFGKDVLLPSGELDRCKIGRLIFGNDDKRRQLNACTHPYIHRRMAWQLLACLLSGEQFVVLDVPLLYETGRLLVIINHVVVVSCSSAQQLCRLMARNDLSEEDAQKRIDSQMSVAEKCRKADVVVDNSGDVEDTRHRVEELYIALRRSKAHWKLRAVLLGLTVGLVGAGQWMLPIVARTLDAMFT